MDFLRPSGLLALRTAVAGKLVHFRAVVHRATVIRVTPYRRPSSTSGTTARTETTVGVRAAVTPGTRETGLGGAGPCDLPPPRQWIHGATRLSAVPRSSLGSPP